MLAPMTWDRLCDKLGGVDPWVVPWCLWSTIYVGHSPFLKSLLGALPDRVLLDSPLPAYLFSCFLSLSPCVCVCTIVSVLALVLLVLHLSSPSVHPLYSLSRLLLSLTLSPSSLCDL